MSIVRRIRRKLTGRHTLEEFVSAGAEIGDHFMPGGHFEMNLDDCWLISIGDWFATGPNVTILAHDASLRNRIGFTKMAPVTIGDHVFLGANTIVLPGVTIGSNTVIAAGSVVAKDIPADSVGAGVPARVIGSVPEMEERWSGAIDPEKTLSLGWKELAKTAEGRAELRSKMVDGVAWAQ